MIARMDSQWGRAMSAFAAMLVAVVVVQTPVATVDRLLHDFGHAHAANAFAGAVIDLPEHDHDGDPDHVVASESPGDEGSAVQVDDDASPEPAPGLSHHHHDGPSAYSLAQEVNPPMTRSSFFMAFWLDDELRAGIGAFGQDRPPKLFLDHVA